MATKMQIPSRGFYVRPGGSVGDSLTDIGALALIGGYDCRNHIKACQDHDGRMFRHPSRLDLHLRPGHVCMDKCDFSRDHIVSLCNYTHWSKDREPLRKFLWFTIRNFGRFCQGSIGQSMINPIVLGLCLDVLGFSLLALPLKFLSWPVLFLDSLFTPVGYRLILAAEVTFLFCLNSKWKVPWVYLLGRIYKREPSNLYYKTIVGRSSKQEALGYRDNFPVDRVGSSWHWNNIDSNREATGVDLEYIASLNDLNTR